ncbi:MAG TPA: SagB/ThcOx family dehydrogenase [Usitatibacter sp.]|nr:SagB/ThcOx family dehydrogenase [Usitatibacter sp.]
MGLPNRHAVDIALPAPRLDRGVSLAEALERRASAREFSDRPLDLHALSALLWSACGVNRPATGQRTAPSARNWQEIEVYVVTAEGIFLHDAAARALVPVAEGDHRAATGLQDFPARAAVNLVYVADYARMTDASSESRDLYAAVDTGAIVQNVYLHCAAAGLACVVRGLVNREALARLLRLRPSQRVTVAQSAGYPAGT